MSKTELSKKLAAEVNSRFKDKGLSLNQNQAGDVVTALFDVISNSLAEGEKVQITGFGTFNVFYVEPHEGINPKDASIKIQIPGRNQVSFSAGAVLKRQINQ